MKFQSLNLELILNFNATWEAVSSDLMDIDERLGIGCCETVICNRKALFQAFFESCRQPWRPAPKSFMIFFRGEICSLPSTETNRT